MRRLIIILIILGFLVIGFATYTFFTRASIEILVLGNAATSQTKVSLNDKTLSAVGTGGRTYKANVAPGNYTINVAAAGFQSQDIEVSLGVRDRETITIELKEKTVQDIASDLAQVDAEQEVIDARFFGENTWITFVVIDKARQTDGLLVVARYNNENSTWEIVGEGTSFSDASLREANAPDDLIKFIGSL